MQVEPIGSPIKVFLSRKMKIWLLCASIKDLLAVNRIFKKAIDEVEYQYSTRARSSGSGIGITTYRGMQVIKLELTFPVRIETSARIGNEDSGGAVNPPRALKTAMVQHCEKQACCA